MTKATRIRINNYLSQGGRVLQVPKESKFIVTGANLQEFEIDEATFDELMESETIELEKYTSLVMKFRGVGQ